ncbi:dTDP-4-dehydrorhamnose reductase [Thermomonas hydrothermalis]|uniref:dTDP-4-dehydrorhamnose reductase n=1 Tax=Thermomonas hydrothermalis TaxID=213588 RepID=A0A1M4XJJ5_9GAMM|nr:dTDP-4-dehydrorhamnose reductase [Thermomonas hydrothermalis]MCL6618369.1 dTDP-4-dehydrorhamnose reductase [Thermomonas hydrothermalis]SHE93685.1 dTDP-4-dehydrorhamnose reductase [Thermomonas hydrothermalis]
MKVLLLGGSGQLGRALRDQLPALGTLVVASRTGADADVAANFDAPDGLTDLVMHIAPDVVVNAAAYTAVDQAEREPDVAFRVNALGPAALAHGCAASGSLLLHYSTDYVFDGKAGRPLCETDRPAPLNVYGASKLAGEQAIAGSGARHVILRTAWVYAAHGHNFLRTMLRLAGTQDTLRVVADQIGTPTPAAWLAQATIAILEQGSSASGVWHCVASGQTSWHGFAEAIMDEALAAGLLARRPQVLPITTADYPTPARRPAYSVLDTSKLQRDFGLTPPDWREGLRDTVRTLAHVQGQAR